MTEQANFIIKDYKVLNPHFYIDVRRFMELECSEEEVKKQIDIIDAANPLDDTQLEAGDLSLKERLKTWVDRIEFIGHLALVSKFAEESNFVIMEQEVRGIHWDIKSLRIYLALTCIDIFCKGEDNHRTHFENVFKNITGNIAKLIDEKLCLKKADGTTGTMNDLALFFYNVRNYYTHMGRRFHILEGVSFKQENPFVSGSKHHKEEQYLIVK